MHGVHEIVPLRAGDEVARALLQRVADTVTPLMMRRGWSVGRLEEFSPRSSALLGLNEGRGARIKLRLRAPGRDADLLAWHHVLGTMLHELVHIE
jgi:DNA-dependent metalloprotease WSS1